MRMETLDAWIDEYLRVIVRTHPWMKRREEEALTRFAEWAGVQEGEVAARLAAEGDRLVQRCAAELGLDVDARDQLRSSVRNLARWAVAEGHLGTGAEWLEA